MVIVVNTRFLLEDYLEGYGNFILETFKRITSRHPEHHFIFIYDREPGKQFEPGPNVQTVVTGPPARHPFLWKWWYDIKVPRVLRKYKADVFVSADGFCSLRTRVPQCLVIHDLAFLHFPSFVSRSHLFFYKRYTPVFLEKARSVATVSEFSKTDITSHYPLSPDSVDVVYNGVKEIFRPLDESSKTAVKSKYTEGKEYFIYTGAVHPRKNLLNLLRAFSVFKKRQKTGMKLVIAGRFAWKTDPLKENIKTYKYREDVVLTGYLPEEELAKLTGSAYAMVYPSLFEGFGVPVIEAMRAGVPVITAAGSAMQEISRGAAIYVDVHDHMAIAEKMMLLYKDENLRRQLVQKGAEVSKEYSWERTAELLWVSIQKAVTK